MIYLDWKEAVRVASVIVVAFLLAVAGVATIVHYTLTHGGGNVHCF